MSPESNVRVLAAEGKTAEDMLRTTLAECAESRSRGKVPQVLVMVLDEGCVPGVWRTPMTLNDLSACAQVAAFVAMLAFEEYRDENS